MQIHVPVHYWAEPKSDSVRGSDEWSCYAGQMLSTTRGNENIADI